MYSLENREQSSFKTSTFALSFQTIFLFGVLNEDIILPKRVCKWLASVNESLFNKQIELFFSYLSCIADSSDYSIIHDILSMETGFQVLQMKIQYSERLWRMHFGQLASAHDGSHFPLSKNFGLQILEPFWIVQDLPPSNHLRAAGFSLRPTAPPSPLTTALTCS